MEVNLTCANAALNAVSEMTRQRMRDELIYKHSLVKTMQSRTRIPSSFFFSSRRRHTRFDCDWSSDVCSSDLKTVGAASPQLFQCGPGLVLLLIVMNRDLRSALRELQGNAAADSARASRRQ